MSLTKMLARYKAKRELKKASAILVKAADNMPSTFLHGLIYDTNKGRFLDSLEARNLLLDMARRLKRDL
jgi:hypothetical protein